MKQIALTAGADGGEAAFDAGKIEDFGLDGATLCDLLIDRLRPYASMLKDGCGFGIMVTAGKASIIGLKDAASPPDSE